MRILADKLAKFVVHTGVVLEDEFDMYQYGLQTGLEMTTCFAAGMCIAIYMHLIPEFLIFITSFIFLRTYAGGLHSENFWSCFLCSVSSQTMILLINKLSHISIMFSWISIAICSIAVIYLSPVANLNREYEEIEKKYFRKKVSEVIQCILLFALLCTILGKEKYMSLIAFTMLLTLGSQYLGKIKYKMQIRRILSGNNS